MEKFTLEIAVVGLVRSKIIKYTTISQSILDPITHFWGLSELLQCLTEFKYIVLKISLNGDVIVILYKMCF